MTQDLKETLDEDFKALTQLAQHPEALVRLRDILDRAWQYVHMEAGLEKRVKELQERESALNKTVKELQVKALQADALEKRVIALKAQASSIAVELMKIQK